MENTPQLRDLKRKLLQRGLPKTYVSRVITELSEHGEDSTHDHLMTGVSGDVIGDVNKLADTIHEKMKTSRFAGRHPIFSFVFSPILTFIATAVLLMVVIDLLPESFLASEEFKPYAYAFFYFLKYILPFSVALAFCFLSKHSFCGYRWSFLTCLALTVFFAPVFIGLSPPIDGIPGSGSFQFGFMLPFWPGHADPSVPETLKWMKDNYLELWRYAPILAFCFYYLLSRVKLREDVISE